QNPSPHAYPQARREEILHADLERSSLRGLTRTFAVSRTTVSNWIKKSSSASSFQYHPAFPPDPEDATSTTLEPYRVWSFVLKKVHRVWVWIALCRKTRQVVAYALGDRSLPDVSTAVGSHPIHLPPGALLHGLLGGILGGHRL